MLMFDLHCHSIFSDGELIPSELVRRVSVMGYNAVAITDHVDHSNIEQVLHAIIEVASKINPHCTTKLIPGVELTHVPPALIPSLAARARKLGAKIVVCHGETLVEPVAPGTNKAALEADIDILAHPGLISDELVKLAAERGIFLELSGRKGHSLSNGHVAKLALVHGAPLIINSDGHSPGDFMTSEFARKVGMGAGLSETQIKHLYHTAWSHISTLIEL